jgi:peptidoglycan/LPS O-acetylase OafA/YrhL
VIGRTINPSYYDGIDFYNGDYLWHGLRALTFTNELWNEHIVFGSNEAYWSLGFEVPFYVIFGIYLFTTGFFRYIMTALLAIIYGPRIMLFMTVWLVGTATFYLVCSSAVSIRYPKALFLFSIAAYAVVKIVIGHDAKYAVQDLQLSSTFRIAIGYIYYMTIALCIATNIIAFSRIEQSAAFGWTPLARTIKWVAGACFTLYIVHQPLMTVVRAGYPGVVESDVASGAALVCILAVCLLLAEIGERRKTFYAEAISRVLPKPKRSSAP